MRPEMSRASPEGPARNAFVTRQGAEARSEPRVAGVNDTPVLPRLVVVGLLEVSDMLDTQLRLRLAAWAEGYRAGETAHADDYELGFYDGVIAMKSEHHEAHKLTVAEVHRWTLRGEPRSRQTFGRPHGDDFPGAAA